MQKKFKSTFLNKFGVYFIGKGLVGVVNFSLIPIYSQTLLPEEFAKIALLMIFIPLVASILKMGQEAAFSIKFYKFTSKERMIALYSIFINYICMSFFIFLVVFYSSGALSKILSFEITPLMTFKLTLILFFCAITEFFFNLLKMEQKAFSYISNTLCFTLMRTLLLVYFIFFIGDGVEGYINASVLSYFLYFLVSLFFIFKAYSIRGFYFDLNQFKSLVFIGLPVVPGMIFSKILTSGDQYMLKEYGLLASVGIYAMSYKFAGFYSSFIIEPFRYALVPIALKKGNENIESFKTFMNIILESFVSILIVITLFIYTFFDMVFYYLIDLGYHDGFNIIFVVIFSLIVWGGANIISNTIVLKEKTHKTMYLTGLSAFLNVFFNALLIPKFDFIGAAYATLITYCIVSVLYFKLSQKLVYIKYNIFRLFIQSVVFCVTVFLYSLISECLGFNLITFFVRFFVFLVVVFAFYKMKWFSSLSLLKRI